MTADAGKPDDAAATIDAGKPDDAAVTRDAGGPDDAAAAGGGPDDAAAAAERCDADPAGDAGRPPRVVFCGGCNPHIDRGAVAAELGTASGSAAGDTAAAGSVGGGAAAGRGEQTGAGREATVYLSGCPRACASDHRLTGDQPGDVVVAGEVVDGRPTPRQDIAATIRQKLKE